MKSKHKARANEYMVREFVSRYIIVVMLGQGLHILRSTGKVMTDVCKFFENLRLAKGEAGVVFRVEERNDHVFNLNPIPTAGRSILSKALVEM